MGGSSLIVEVNNQPLPKPLLIFGTPKCVPRSAKSDVRSPPPSPRLAYPYKKDSTEYKDLSPDTKTYVLANKWNGMNILFFKYSDAAGREYISAKSKGSAFLSDSAYYMLQRTCAQRDALQRNSTTFNTLTRHSAIRRLLYKHTQRTR